MCLVFIDKNVCNLNLHFGIVSNHKFTLYVTDIIRSKILLLNNSRGYFFCFTVFFWVLALDHDLRVASDIIGSVFVRNPAGTKVALWEEVALDEGELTFQIFTILTNREQTKMKHQYAKENHI